MQNKTFYESSLPVKIDWTQIICNPRADVYVWAETIFSLL